MDADVETKTVSVIREKDSRKFDILRRDVVKGCRIRGCKHHAAARGLCIGHYAKLRSDGKLQMWPKPRVKCECGMIVRGPKPHKAGFWHKNYRRITALLSNPCMRLEEIGNRLGVTKQAVHLYATKAGLEIDQEKRRKVCTKSRRVQGERANFVKHFPKIARGLDRQGFAWKVKRNVASSRVPASIEVEGIRCAVGRSKRSLGPYVRVGWATPRMNQFKLHQARNGVFVFPRELFRLRQSTTFRFGEFGRNSKARNHAAAGSARHGWMDYFNAWHLLRDALKKKAG